MKNLNTLFVDDNGAAQNIDDWFGTCCSIAIGNYESNFQLWQSWIAFAAKHDMHTASPKRLAMYFRYRGLKQARLASGSVRVWRGVRLNVNNSNTEIFKFTLLSHAPTHFGVKP